MIAALAIISAVNVALWLYVIRDWSRFRRWMRTEDARDANAFRGLGQLRAEMQQARDELADARARLDWAVDQIIEHLPDNYQ
jgi:HAMP domain-containing protein